MALWSLDCEPRLGMNHTACLAERDGIHGHGAKPRLQSLLHAAVYKALLEIWSLP